MSYWETLYIWNDEDDKYMGRVTLDVLEGAGPDDFDSLTPTMVHREYGPEFEYAINNAVEEAKDGVLYRKVELILALAHCLENSWRIPEALASYMSKALTDAAVAFGHANVTSHKNPNPNTNKKYKAVSTALGLIVPVGRKTYPERDEIIHGYIRWRMKLYKENSVFEAAKSAEIAFAGSKLGAHDNFEKIYNRHNKKVSNAQPLICPSTYALLADGANCRVGIKFKDDDFLENAIPYIDDKHPLKMEWLEKWSKES